MTRVLKFGGSSVADAACMRQVASLAKKALDSAPLIVLSASGKTTDALFRAAREAESGALPAAKARLGAIEAHHRTIARELFGERAPLELERAFSREFEELVRQLEGVALLGELSARSLDAIVSHGELLSTRIFAALLAREEVDAEWFDARSVIRTDANFGSAEPHTPTIASLVAEQLASKVRANRAIVTQGYIGSTAQGLTTTLGRGGSDWSASLFGAALGVDEVQIWTDVEGVCTADPRWVPSARAIADLSFAEASELAAFGAKVLHPATIQPAIEKKIPVTVRHTMRPEGRFTTIRAESKSARPVTALASRGPVTVLTVGSTRMLAHAGFLARLFEVFGRVGVSVDLVATAEVSVSLTVEADAPVDQLRAELARFARVDIARDRAIVAVVGERLRTTPGIAARALAALGDINVEMISMGANEINLSFVLERSRERDAVERLHAALFEAPIS